MEVLEYPKTAFDTGRDEVFEPFPFSMAFQPIVDVESASVYAYEALVRGPQQEPAAFVLGQVNGENLYAFDQACRVKAITLASRLGLDHTAALLSINIIPGAIMNASASIQLTVKTAGRLNFPLDRLLFEIVEVERVASHAQLMDVVNEYRNCGLRLAIDDFGAGWSGLGLLAKVPAHAVKLDVDLIRRVHQRPKARAIVQSIARLAEALDFELIAKGVETGAEFHALRDCGIRLMQGYLFARPGFEHLPDIDLHSKL